MRELAQDTIADEVLHELWIAQLPAQVRPYLLMSPDLNNLTALAELADQFVQNAPNNSIFAVNNCLVPQTHSGSKIERALFEVQLTLKTLQQEVGNIQT